MKKLCLLFCSAAAFYFISCNNDDNAANTNNSTAASQVKILSYNIAAVHPHDTSFFTEGLEFYNGALLESTGLNGRSRIIKMDFPSGKILSQVQLADKYFGEGITVFKDTLYQLTWQEHVVHVYNAKDFSKIKELSINTEGWGLTNNGKELIASDGSSNLYFYEPQTFRLLRVQSVTENDAPAVNLNELEYIDGFVYANQWQYNYILKIDPSNGQVVAKLDFTDLVNGVRAKDANAEFLNGIAYDPATKKVYITGKHWPQIFEVEFAF